MPTPTVRPANRAAISEAALVLAGGGLVAFPTETVYGLGATAENDNALIRLFSAKSRPRMNPLIVHVRSREDAEANASFHSVARGLAETFWPGALTLVLPRRRDSKISLLTSAGLDTLALRIPAHPVAAALLNEFGLPIAAPSANPSGRLSPTSAKHVAADFGGRVDLILDAGTTPLGLESTIIGFDGNVPLLLRTGAITRDAIEQVCGKLAMPRLGDRPTSPGQLKSHYAPRAQLRLDVGSVNQDEALLAFGDPVPPGAIRTLNLSVTGDLNEAAANLFTMLRELDATRASVIAVMPIPQSGLGEAINDRLRRAAAPREVAC